MMMWLWLCVLCVCMDVVSAESTRLVLGLGPGLVAVVVLAIACVIICVAASASQDKSRFIIAVLVIVGGTTLFFATVSVHEPNSAGKATAVKYNRTAVTRSAVAGILIGFTIISGFSLLLTHVLKARQGHFIGEAARRGLEPRVF